jgi:hypothetical protein
MSSEATPGIARARDRLHGRDEQLLDPERAMEWGKSEDQRGGGAVGVGQDGAGPAAGLVLPVHQRQVVEVGLGDEERHVRVHPVITGVGDDVRARRRERLLDWPGYVRVERAEDDRARERRDACLDREASDPTGQRGALAPAHDLTVAPARAGG